MFCLVIKSVVVPFYSFLTCQNQIERVKSGLDFILVTGKSLFTRGADFENFLGVDWKLVIVDEFHEYKNPKSQAHQSLVSISTHAQCPVIGMTGTLMQNNHEELFHLIDLARPSLLGDKKSFIDYTAKPIKYARAKDAKDDVKQLGKKREQELMHAIKPAYLERKKNVVLKDTLTKKNEKVIFCELSEIQKKLYRHIITLPDYYLLKTMNGPVRVGK